MIRNETEVIEVYADAIEVECDVEGCGRTARPPQSAYPDRAGEPFEEAVPDLTGWVAVQVVASPTDEDSGEGTFFHVCPDHIDGAWETTDLMLKNLTSTLQGYLARRGLDLKDSNPSRE